MDLVKQNILRDNEKLIVHDLHGDVFECLRNKGALTDEDYHAVTSLDQQEKKNEKLLNILINKQDGLEQLIDSLKEWYPWIHSKLKTSLPKVPLKEAFLADTIAQNVIPAIPRRHVSRCALLNRLRSELKQLQKGYYVVLHGMSGCGKSSLAAEVLNFHESNNTLIEQFEGRVIWLSCGPEANTGDINELLGLMVELNARICDEDLISDVKTVNLKTLRITLTKRFHNSSFKEALLVLDGVNSVDIIEALNIGCKTLVTTNDENVMRNQGSRYKSIKVNEGFTEEETLTQFASCVGLSVDELPSQAKQIHLHGKGHPLIMSLIAAHLEDHQEEARNNTDAWNPYLDVLINKDYGNLRRESYGGAKFMPETIDLCINNLSPDNKIKYQDFALFVEDVNIKTEVLEILWGLSSFEVSKIMDEFHSKSLIVRKYNADKSYYVYAVHDLLLYHLKKPLKKNDTLKDLHLKLISRYQEKCNDDLSRLPKNDNYILYYIGYHIANSKKYSLFPKWYFNLDFVEAKLKVTGLADLLTDYKRYGPLFTSGLTQEQSSVIVKQLANFVRFVESSGVSVRKNNGPDIIQFALQEPHDSEVYKIAVNLVQCRPNASYLHFQLGPSENRFIPCTIQTKERVTSACFLKNNCDLLVGFEPGIIQVMNNKGYVTRIYEKHPEKVTRVSVSSARDIFLSVSESCVKVWHLPDLDSSVSLEPGNRTPSPSQRQQDFTDMFNHKTVEKRMSWLTYNISCADWATFSTNGCYMATCCSQKQLVQVWEMSNKGPLVKKIRAPGTTCVFSGNDELLIIGCSNSFIFIHNVMNNSAINHLVDSYPILALFVLPADFALGNEVDMKFGSLTKATLCVWEIENTTVSPVDQHTVPCLRDYNKGESESYISCAAASDGTVVAVATSSGKILICNLNNGSVVREINYLSGNIGYLAIDGSEKHMLLACYNDTTIQLWVLGDVDSGKPATMKANFDVTWTDSKMPILVAPTYKSFVKKISRKTEYEDIHIPGGSEINVCSISKCGKYTAISSSNNKVYLHCSINGIASRQIFEIEKCASKLRVDISQGNILVAALLDRSFKVWVCGVEEWLSQSNGARVFTVPLNDRLLDCFILTSGQFLTATKNGSIMKWSLNGEKFDPVVICPARFDVTICACDIDSGNVVATTLDNRRKRLNIYYLDRREKQSVELVTQPVCCSFSSDGCNLAVGFINGDIELWSTEAGILTYCGRLQVMNEAVRSICVSDHGLMGAAGEGRVLLGHLNGRVGQAKLQVERVVMSPDNNTVLTVDTDGHMHLIDLFVTDESLTSSVSSLSFKSEKSL